MRRSTKMLTILFLAGGGLGCASARAGADRGAVPLPIPAPRQGVAALVQRLEAADPKARAQAAWDLEGVKGVGAEVLDALRAATSDQDRRVRYAATWALSHAEPQASVAPTGPPPFDVAPQQIGMTGPVYPPQAFHEKVQGTVVVEILIGEEGEVALARVAESIAGLDHAALDCVRKWRFKPATQAGRPVACVAKAPVAFRITK